MGLPELQDIVGTTDNPRNPRNFTLAQVEKKRRRSEKCPNPNWIKKPKSRKHPGKEFIPRVEKAIAVLERCDPEFTSFITVILSVCPNYNEVQEYLERSMTAFRQCLVRRFPDHKALLFGEVDAKLVRDIDPSLLADNSWLSGLSSNTIVFVVHLHGTVYTRHVAGSEIAAAIRSNPNGKRSMLYGGSRQVFAEPLDRIEEADRIVLDVRGVSGYSTKSHYRPPVVTRMMEGLAECLLINDAIVKSPRSILISGMRDMKAYGGSRPTLTKLRAFMKRQRRRMTPHERWEDELVDVTDQERIEVSEPGTGEPMPDATIGDADSWMYLNSDLVSSCIGMAKSRGKKLAELFQAALRMTRSFVKNLVSRRSKVVETRVLLRQTGDPPPRDAFDTS